MTTVMLCYHHTAPCTVNRKSSQTLLQFLPKHLNSWAAGKWQKPEISRGTEISMEFCHTPILPRIQLFT